MASTPAPILPIKPTCQTNVNTDLTELQKLYACRDASNCYSNVNIYNSEVAAYNDIQSKRLSEALAEYDKRRKAHDARLNEWVDRKGEFVKYKNYGKNNEFWATSHDGTCWAGENWNAAHSWCHNAANNKGYDGDNYWAKQWGWCYGRWGNFLCQKPTEIILAQEAEYQSVKPQFFEVKPTAEKDYPKAEQLLPGNVNIQCCANTMSGSGNFTDNIQECKQEIEQKISTLLVSSPSPINTVETPSTENITTPQPLNDEQNNDDVVNILVILVILVIVFSILSSIYSIFLR